ncbi:MAG: hypothetical protein PHC41_07955 [Lachnospiraceae bacterium]|nr:hypothetical protein [Lachnospiraceae bacterium]MDD3616148.1 hypothetical protein [Lachnospiraceae bacterium]
MLRLKTRNPGIREAITELMSMNVSEEFQKIRDARLKERRDRLAREDYVRDCGIEIGIEKGIEKGIEALILDNKENGIPEEKILEKLVKRFQLSKEKAKEYFDKYSNN